MTTTQPTLVQHFRSLQQEFCTLLPQQQVDRLFNAPDQHARLLLAFVESPRPLHVVRLIQNGLPDYGLNKNDAQLALLVLQGLRLVRNCHKLHLCLTRRGEALAGAVVAHFHSVH